MKKAKEKTKNVEEKMAAEGTKVKEGAKEAEAKLKKKLF